MSAQDERREEVPTLTIHTKGRCDKEIIVTGGSLHMRVDFDDVDHVAVAHELGLAVDAINSHAALIAANQKLREALEAISALAKRRRLQTGSPSQRHEDYERIAEAVLIPVRP